VHQAEGADGAGTTVSHATRHNPFSVPNCYCRVYWQAAGKFVMVCSQAMLLGDHLLVIQRSDFAGAALQGDR
jgi:hypothetical protein